MLGWGDIRRVRRIHLKNLHRERLLDISRRNERANLDDPRFGRAMSRLFITLTIGKTPHIYAHRKSFLFSEVARQGWVWTSSPSWMTSSFTKPLPLFSFMVTISIHKKYIYKKENLLEPRRINSSRRNEINDLRLRVVVHGRVLP